MTFNYEEKGGASKATRRACYLTIPFSPAANTWNAHAESLSFQTTRTKFVQVPKGKGSVLFLCGQQQQAALLWGKRVRLNEGTDGVINLKRGMPRGTRCSFKAAGRGKGMPAHLSQV